MFSKRHLTLISVNKSLSLNRDKQASQECQTYIGVYRGALIILTGRSQWCRRTKDPSRIQFARNWPPQEQQIQESRRELVASWKDRIDVQVQSRWVWYGFQSVSNIKCSLAEYYETDYNLLILKVLSIHVMWLQCTFISRWSTCWRWINWIPSQICRIKMAQALSVRTKSSSMTRSKSSPPSILRQ